MNKETKTVEDIVANGLELARLKQDNEYNQT
jgi:hypothetical protein